ncbi:MAG: hypothetical protein ACYDBP_00215 [Leptospirales bacterium]
MTKTRVVVLMIAGILLTLPACSIGSALIGMPELGGTTTACSETHRVTHPDGSVGYVTESCMPKGQTVVAGAPGCFPAPSPQTAMNFNLTMVWTPIGRVAYPESCPLVVGYNPQITTYTLWYRGHRVIGNYPNEAPTETVFIEDLTQIYYRQNPNITRVWLSQGAMRQIAMLPQRAKNLYPTLPQPGSPGAQNGGPGNYGYGPNGQLGPVGPAYGPIGTTPGIMP